MKRWEKCLLLVMVAVLLSGIFFGDTSADTERLPANTVYGWWGVVYPNAATPDPAAEEAYIVKLRAVELWQQLRQWMKSGAH